MAHRRDVLLRRHPLPVLHHARQHPEIVDVVRRRVRVGEPRLLVERVRERVGRPRGHDDPLADSAVDVGLAGDVEAQDALRGGEALVVHLVPVHRRAGRLRGNDEFGYADAVVCEESGEQSGSN